MKNYFVIFFIGISLSLSAQGDLDDAANIQQAAAWFKDRASEAHTIAKSSKFIKNAKVIVDIYKLFESTACNYEGMGFYVAQLDSLGYEDCFIKTKLKVIDFRFKTGALLILATMRSYIESDASTRMTAIQEALKSYDEAITELHDAKVEITRKIDEDFYEKKRNLKQGKEAVDKYEFYRTK